MKIRPLVAVLIAASTVAYSQYPDVTIRQIQEVPLDSLLLLDSLQRTQLVRWTAQVSPYYHDTVRVTGVCVVPARLMGFTASGFNFQLADTGSRMEWGGLFVRPNLSTGSPDTVLWVQWGMLLIQPGDIVRFVGYVDELPAPDCVSTTQVVPLLNYPLQVIGHVPVPQPVQVHVSDFYQGLYPGGRIRFSTGERYEGMRVLIRNVTVVSYVNQTYCTFSFIDSAGNQMSDFDGSRWCTCRMWRDPTSRWGLPPIGTRLDSIVGLILSNSGQEAARGYRIAPIYPEDVVVMPVPPQASDARRSPMVVPSDSNVTVSFHTHAGVQGFRIDSVSLFYSVNDSPFVRRSMTYSLIDSTARGVIPARGENSLVRYFFRVKDDHGYSTVLANYSSSRQNDTSWGTFFYTVLDRPLTIRDIQYSPFRGGYSQFATGSTSGATVTVSGIVTADSTDWRGIPGYPSGGCRWFLQSASEAWSGIWIDGSDSTMGPLRRGDSVTVRGMVEQWFGSTTRIRFLQNPVIVHSAGNQIPAPVVKTTGSFVSTLFGNPDARPCLGMLVSCSNAVVTAMGLDTIDYQVDDGTGPVLVERYGKVSYVPRYGDRISLLTGVVHYFRGIYRLLPRTDDDIGPVTSVGIIGEPPGTFGLQQNYPNPFNPSTTIRYALPHASFVTLTVYNTVGQGVAQLVNEPQQAGYHEAVFRGDGLASGVYFYTLRAAGFVQTRKLVLVR